MALISEFIDDYKGKIGHYEHLAQTCACQCESALKRQGIRALVTSRAKKLDSLASKVETRAKEKAYQSIEEIYDDIVDLAGVRVALYFQLSTQDYRVSTLTWIMSRIFLRPCSIQERIKNDFWAMWAATTVCA